MSERIGLYLLSFLVFGLVMGVLIWWQSNNLFFGIVTGAIGGAGFSLFMFLFTIVVKKFQVFGIKKIEGWAPDETIIHFGDANMICNGLAEGGQLFLTNTRLRFVGHRFGAQILDSSYALRELAWAAPSKTIGLIPNGLRVSFQDGRVLQFVVYGRRQWADKLNQATQC